MKKAVITKIVIALDLAGWEQDGKGPVFVKPDTGERKKFQNWTDAYYFALEVHGKTPPENKTSWRGKDVEKV